MIKKIAALMLSALLLLFAMGCGNDSQQVTPAQPGQEQGMPDEPAMAPEPGAPAPAQPK